MKACSSTGAMQSTAFIIKNYEMLHLLLKVAKCCNQNLLQEVGPPRERGRRQSTPGPQGQRGLITPSV